ncbi:hypothetical protein G9A89_020010 [Geosiphon pyriformis]|nr:hypothetical protein G9A89_020010 [Geosiphon pyriformis]
MLRKKLDGIVFSWHPYHLLLFPVHVRVSPSNNFLAGVVCIFSGCDLSLGGSLAGAFCLWCGTPMFLILGETIFFKCVSSLRCYGIAFIEQLYWISMTRSPFGLISLYIFLVSVGGSSDIRQSLGFGVICNDLLSAGAAHFSVYTNGSLSNLDTVDILAGAAVFFENIDSGLGVGVSGLVSSTLAELQVIALALKCVPFFHSVDLFSDSQAAINACKSESLSVGPDFRNCCWIEHCHITNIIRHKNLDVNWIKVKSHSGVSGNEHANALAKNAALSAWHLPYLVGKRFLKAGVDTVSGNSRHFVHDIFRSIHYMHWEVGFGSQVVLDCLRADIDWLKSSLVWHPDSHMVTGFTSIWMAGFHTYFIKALYHHLPVAMRKRLYNRGYPSVVCLFCGEVEVSDHVFSCSSNTDSCANLLDTYAAAWKLLSTCISDVTVSMALCKGFVFSNWYCESVSVYKDPKVTVVNVVNFLIPHHNSIPVTISGFSAQLLAGVIRLLGVADALSISFGYHKCCLFYVGVGDMASVHIST